MNKPLIARIKEMKKIDQSLRFAARGSRDKQANFLVYLVDAVHNYWIHRIIEDLGYPTVGSVGEETLYDFWLLLQHQVYDIALQQRCMEECGFSLACRAYLIDRIRMTQGVPQLYGTQSHRGEDGDLVRWPIEDEGNLEARRESMGLESLSRCSENNI